MTAGLSSGVAVLVVCGVVSDLFGVRPPISLSEVHEGVVAILQRASFVAPSAVIIATLTLIVLCRKISALIPASLIATSIGVLLVKFHHLPVKTICSPSGSVVWLFHPIPPGSLS